MQTHSQVNFALQQEYVGYSVKSLVFGDTLKSNYVFMPRCYDKKKVITLIFCFFQFFKICLTLIFYLFIL